MGDHTSPSEIQKIKESQMIEEKEVQISQSELDIRTAELAVQVQ